MKRKVEVYESDDMYISSHTRRKDLLKSLEQITKNEIEWSTSEE